MVSLPRLLPLACLLCGRITDRNLCVDCTAALPRNVCACAICGLPLVTQPLPGGTCGACFGRPPPFVRTVAPLLYRPPVTTLVQRAKFYGGLVDANVLGELLADAVAIAYPDDEALPDVVVPVPLSWRRLMWRGHNQAGLIARRPAAKTRVPIDYDLCRRVRHTPPQTGLSRTARGRNLTRAFDVRRAPPARVALVDDVMTTGTTLRSLARALLAAGAAEVHVWVAARTPGFAPKP